jgi:hypothetical protein
MIYKKKSFFSFLCFTVLFSALLSAQDAPKDLIVLVDTSASMSSFYANVTNYLTGPFLAENLNLGDTFHLISFSGKPRFEIARRVIDLGDVQTVNGRIFLLYPLEPVSDISAAISYGEKYTTILPSGRQKRMFIVSDSEEKDVEGMVNASAGRLQNAGTTIRYLKVPFSAAARTAQTPLPQDRQTVSSNSQNQPGASGSPAQTGSSGSTGSPPSQNVSGSAGSQESTILSESADSLDSSSSSDSPGSSGTQAPSGPQTESSISSDSPPVLPEPETGSSETVPGALPDSGKIQNSQTNPSDQNVPAENRTEEDAGLRRSFGSFISSLPLPLLIALGILILLILGFIIIMMLRNLNFSPNRVMASATTIDDGSAARNAELLNSFATTTKAASRISPHRRYHRDDQNQFLSNPSMLNLFVEDQNTAIGRRNVHTLKTGSRFTVGGGNSDFLIFLVPMPPRIGELRFDGTNCTFIPLKSKYFPDIGSQQIPECIGKTIRVLSDKGYELFFHFERYKDPLIALNQLLHSINVPEK